MAVLCKDHGLLFLMSPRTGCTAVAEVLCRHLGGEHLPAEDLLDTEGHVRVQKKHSTLRELLTEGLLTADEADGLFKVTAVRNPFDSLVSLYVKQSRTYQPLLDDPDSWVHKVKGYADDLEFTRDHTFDEWVLRQFRDPGTMGSWRLRLGTAVRGVLGRTDASDSVPDRFAKGADYVMRFEQLQADFDHVLDRVGHRRIEIPRVNQTGEREGRHYRSYFTARSRRTVEYHFQRSLAYFNYRF